MRIIVWLILIGFVVPDAYAQRGQFDKTPVNAADERIVVTPPGFTVPGRIAAPPGEMAARLEVNVLDSATGRPIACRVNVVGPDGNYYHPADHPLSPYSLTGNWPEQGQGNRLGKAPIRYFGHFFYSTGRFSVDAPAGAVRVEVWKGFEYAPQSVNTELRAGDTKRVEVRLTRAIDAPKLGYWSGDPHLHFPRGADSEDQLIFDLLSAEDIRYGVVMCYNETNAYSGTMAQLVMPQLRGLGRRSIAERDQQQIISGQEYRNNVYGHLNLFLRNDLVEAGSSYDPNLWPVFGIVGRETRQQGGVAIHAHGGYAQEIYADLVQGTTHGVELLQFGIYRGIGLDNWYRVLNCGFRFPAVGASDYPACRKLGDCQTYVYAEKEPIIEEWLAGLGAGKSFVTTGPILLLEVDGHRPGETISVKSDGAKPITARVRARSEVAPITHLQLIARGKVLKQIEFSRDGGLGRWLELEAPASVEESTWIAARAFSSSLTGSPDAEAHTNPVYVYRDNRRPYDEKAIDWLAGEIDAQVEEHSRRDFPEKGRVVEYFSQSREILDNLRRQQGLEAPSEKGDSP